MDPSPSLRLRTGALLAGAGIAFAAFPLLRPWGDKAGSLSAMADAFASPWWVIAHALGMLGWILLAAVVTIVGERGPSVLLLVGVASMLPFYGAETFGLHGLARYAAVIDDPSLVRAEALIRGDLLAQGLFALGMVVAAIAVAVLALRLRRRRGVRWAAGAAAVLIALYLPQFFAPDALRIAHGVLLGMALIGWTLAAATPRPQITSSRQ
ncbi:MAG: hypothetical protein Q4G40_00310 [Brachybacterium sp.]|nr:hypothetical protein [Brachybacterium sp.]